MEVAELITQDHELWYCDGAGWSLPVLCIPFTADGTRCTHWKVKPAFSMLAGPHARLTEVFGPVALSNSGTHWIIPQDCLAQRAKKAPGVTARFYYKWDEKENTDRQLVGTEEVDDRKEREDEFVKFFCELAVVDIRIGRMFWHALKRGMQVWLINKQKPIDFELFEVHPVPYRANWKEIMISKHPFSHKYFYRGKITNQKKLFTTGFLDDLGSSDLMSMREKGKIFRWTLEVLPKKLWLDSMESAELDRMAIKKPAGYAKYYETCLRRRYDDLLAIYGSYVREITHPVGTVCESPTSGRPVVVPQNKSQRVLPNFQRPTEITYQAWNGAHLKDGARYEYRVERKIEKMLGLPTVQPDIENMRNCNERKLLGGLAGNTGGATGVPVLDADKGTIEVGGVLAGGEEPGR